MRRPPPSTHTDTLDPIFTPLRYATQAARRCDEGTTRATLTLALRLLAPHTTHTPPPTTHAHTQRATKSIRWVFNPDVLIVGKALQGLCSKLARDSLAAVIVTRPSSTATPFRTVGTLLQHTYTHTRVRCRPLCLALSLSARAFLPGKRASPLSRDLPMIYHILTMPDSALTCAVITQNV